MLDLNEFDTAVKAALTPDEPLTDKVFNALNELPLDSRLATLNSMMAEAFLAKTAHTGCNHEHSQEEILEAMALSVQQAMFTVAMSAGYYLGHREASSMISDTSNEIDRLLGGDHE